MSWTETFPILSDELISEYRAGATSSELAVCNEWTNITQVLNESSPSARHIVSFALYWKPLRESEPDLAKPTLGNFKNPRISGRVEGESLWGGRVAPLLKIAREILPRRPDICFRVHLAADLAFLAEDLTRAGCEVVLMQSSSLRDCPGALWRFLPLEERGKLITVSTATTSQDVEQDIARTEAIARAGLGLWRVPHVAPADESYLPISPMRFGATCHFPIRKLLAALAWHTERGTIPTTCRLPGGCGERKVTGVRWPGKGFDGWFLLSAVYPRAARKGLLTFIHVGAYSRMLPCDIEYATWSNSRSEMMYFGEATDCCAPKVVAPFKREEAPYWRSLAGLPFLLNSMGLKGQAVQVGARDNRIPSTVLPSWDGSRWNVVEAWTPRPISAWVDSENFQSAAEWTQAQSAFLQFAATDKRIRIIEDAEERSVQRFTNGSLDCVFLNRDKSYDGVLKSVEQWWPKLRNGGVMAGLKCTDSFSGLPNQSHTWSATRAALSEWSRRTGHGFFVTSDEHQAWIMFKTRLPEPKDVLVITGATKEVTYADASTENHRAYCAKWGHPYHLFGEDDFDRGRGLCWSKIKMLRKALRRSPWVLWIDCDAVFSNWDVPITRLCLEPFHLVCGIWDYMGTPRPSSGVMMMQRGSWSQEFLDHVWSYRKSHNSGAWEEDAMWSFMRRSAKFRKGMLAVDCRELNSPVPSPFWDPADPILHFLQLRKTRDSVVRDACKMIRERNGMRANGGVQNRVGLVDPQAKNGTRGRSVLPGEGAVFTGLVSEVP